MNKNLKALVVLSTIYAIIGCDTLGGQLKEKADQERLLKPGALDGKISIPDKYPSYRYRFMDKYYISHDWYGWNGCQYASKYNGEFFAGSDIFEKDGHTFQETIYGRSDPRTIDQYTRPEFANGTDSHGNVRMAKGFQPICNQSWYLSQHVIEIELRKQNIDELMDAARKYDSTLVFESRKVNGNLWHVRFSELGLAPLNGAGGPFQTWLLPIGDTGYTFIFGLGANQDSLKYPQAHAQIQAIFKHLIESVKIDLLPLAK